MPAHFPPARVIATLAIALVLGISSASNTHAAANTQIADSALPNGLRIFVKTDRRAPVVVCMVWYRVGSIDEVNGTTGVAHVLEHMMFKGTKAVPAGEDRK